MAVPGVEGQHTWDGVLTLNDLTVWPRYKLRPPIGGLRSRADFDLAAATGNAVGRRGEIARRGFRAGKTIVFAGAVQGRTLAEVQEGVDAMEEAFDTDEERQMISARLPALGGDAYTWWARVEHVEIPDAPASPFGVSQGHERDFVVALRMSDPRFLDTTERLAVTAPLAASAGLAPPFTPPVVLPSGAPAGAVTAHNAGRTDTDPVIDLYGPVTNPVIENTTIGKRLRFTASLAAGSFLRVDFAKRRVTLDGVTEAGAFRDQPGSDWWDAGVKGLAKGDNVIRYSGDSISDPAVAQVRFYDAFLS